MNITQWSPGELEIFSHKLEQVIHGPDAVGKVGFIFIAYPITNESAAKMLSNCDGQTVVTVLYKVLQGLVDREPKQ
jgi:hypothetical protein